MRQRQASRHKQAGISKQAMWNAKGEPIAQSVGEPAQGSVGALWEDSGSIRAKVSIAARDSGTRYTLRECYWRNIE